MQAIIDLTRCKSCKNSSEKVAGVSILMRHIISLSRNQAEKIVVIQGEKSVLSGMEKDKRVTCPVVFSTDFASAIKETSGDVFVIGEDVVYSQNLFKIGSPDNHILRFGELAVFYIPDNEKKRIQDFNDLIGLSSVKELEGIYFRCIQDKSAIKKAEKEMVKGLRTSGDTLISRLMNRSISLWVTARIMHYPITPNFITTFNLLLGIAAVICVWVIPGYWKQAIAGTLFHLSSVLDGCDGEIARLKFQGSKFGAKYDDFADEFTNFLFYPGVGLYAAIYWFHLNTFILIITLIGTFFYTIGKFIYFWLNTKIFHIDNVKYLQFYFEKNKENWGKNPVLWVFKIGRHVVRNDFLAFLAMVTGFLQLYWTAPYVVFVFGTAYFISIFLELLNALKKRRSQSVS